MGRKIFTLLLFSLFTLCSLAQKSTITGKVLDSENGEALQSCTVILMRPDTTGMVTGNVTNDKGTWTLKNVSDGDYVLKISYIGYHNFFRKISVNSKKNSSLNVGTILLTPSSIELKQAVVTGVLKEVEVKEDTIIFNADAFKVPEGSVLEELIRKLPGAEVADDGTVTINGKKVNKILVEGKEFFGNDKNMAMKNIPTEIVDKIKSYDKQSDLSKMTGIDDGNEETVIDIGIKKGMKKGWFGNADLAYGTHNRFANRLMANRFTDGLQASVIGSFNNTGDRTGGGGGRGGNNGNTTSAMAGANIALDLKKWEIGGNIHYNHTKTDRETYTSSQNFTSANSSWSNSLNNNINRNGNVNGDFKIEWRPDSLTTVLFRPAFSYGESGSESNGNSATFNDDPNLPDINNVLDDIDLIPDSIKVNTNKNKNWNDGKNYNANGNLTATRKIKGRPWFGESNPTGLNGRNVSVRLSGGINGSESLSSNMSDVKYYQQNGRQQLTYRSRSNPSDNRNYTLGATYNEPIMRNLYLQGNYSYNYSKRHADGSTYDYAKIDSIGRELWEKYGQYGIEIPEYEKYRSDSLSRYTDNINKTHNAEFSLRLITSLLNISAGVRIENQTQEMLYRYQGLDTLASRNFTRISPTLNARFRFTKQHTLRLTYRGNSNQPSMTDLFDLTDNSNPLNIREGNPNLKPSFNNNVNLDYNNYLQDQSMSIFGRFSFSNTSNEITSRTEYNEETGGQITKPVNIEGFGDWNINGNIGLNTPIIWENFTLNTNTTGRYSNNVGYLYQNKETIINHVRQTSLGERLSLTLRLGYWDIRANGNITWSKTKSEYVEASNQSTFNFHYGLSSTGNFENGIGFSTDIGMNSRRGYSASEMNTNELIWNAQISYRFLKNRAATVSIQAYDILNQRSNISRQISAYSQRDSRTNSINSYVMVHFVYRLNLFGTKSARQNLRNQRQMRDAMEREGGMPGGNFEGMGGNGRFGGGGFGGGGFGGGGGRNM